MKLERDNSSVWRRSIVAELVIMAAILVLALVLVRTAWMSDDAFITLRTIDNLTHGYGLRWNAAERVQAYTHPLWMLLLTAFYFVTGEGYYTTIALSIVLTLATVVILAWQIAVSPKSALFAVLALTLSKAFTDYATSGLENVLTHLLLSVFFVTYLRWNASLGRLFLLSLITALVALNRLDAVLIILPLFLLALFESRSLFCDRRFVSVGAVALGFIPFVMWEGFSLLYYGFLVPNTFFAKLNTGISHYILIGQGLTYFLQSTLIDPFTTLVVVAGLAVAVWCRSRRLLAFAAGIVLYLLYIVWIGGDFMSGRFLSAPLLCAVMIVASTRLTHGYARLVPTFAVMLIVGLLAPYSPIPGDRFKPCEVVGIGLSGVADERGCYYEGTGLLRQSKQAPTAPNHGNARLGLEVRDDLRPVQIMGAVGIYSFFAGPGKYIVDLNALADPFLARLPIPKDKPWRIGHFERFLPGGYIETLISGHNMICNPSLAQYYDKLTLITRGKLLDGQRLSAIWKMNTGQYDRLLRDYDPPGSDQDMLCNAQAVADVWFVGGPHLRGYAVSSTELKPGGEVTMFLYWQGKPQNDTVLYSFVHIRNSRPDMPVNPRSGSDIWAQELNEVPGGRLTSEYWGRQIYSDYFAIPIPEDMPLGEYFLEVGWYNPQSGEQLDPQPETVKSPLKILWRSILLPSIAVR